MKERWERSWERGEVGQTSGFPQRKDVHLLASFDGETNVAEC